MALYLKEKINQQKKEVPLNDKIIFTFPWIITTALPPPNGEDQIRNLSFKTLFSTCYKFHHDTWQMKLSAKEIKIGFYGSTNRHGKGSCFVSYNLYYDNEMRFLLYSSRRIQLNKLANTDIFKTQDIAFMERMVQAYNGRKIAKIFIFVELHLCTKIFSSPNFDMFLPGDGVCVPYPSDINTDFRFSTFTDSDFEIRCSDETVVPSRRMILNVASKFFGKYFKRSNERKIDVDHQSDVVKPIEIFLRTSYFEMPKTYNLDFAKRLFEAIEFFEPLNNLGFAIERELCFKFVAEDHDFDSILLWLSLASPNSLECLGDMIIAVIADKFYLKWQETFPENARNEENPLFLATFSSNPGMLFERIFEYIDDIYKCAFLTAVTYRNVMK